MPIPIRETFATDRPDLQVMVTDDGSRTLLKTGTHDSFHSGCGALSETKHVYLQNSGIATRLTSRQPTSVLEVGLGTAMGLLVTLEQSLLHDTELYYAALETDWIAASTMRYLDPETWSSYPGLVDRYLDFRSSHANTTGPGTFRWSVDAKRTVDIHLTDALNWSPDHSQCPCHLMPFDAVYYDPFCPDTAPELWTSDCFKRMRTYVASHATLTTYSCSRVVRDAMSAAGWDVERVAGPIGGKREVLVATPAINHID
ncbi:tRNA (5-methylaminomethyl-2-thiouridine)(34)-methyltransferase MnmD [Stieleria sp. JC731]|uniref:tRNA (5-methylaminomethyl-2-thiouridine)(34)-methyltransferase MnmD n=1 Tax=Pirellulaceae TaxID=2691357 RepID=UPI001E4B7D54|nr:tRNA (5-methylaminomethyl-2-thiouridine)(34)-methyltransferase MnmD [Stieleria sp. JC731]MCC9602690.1 tRNA (5-methylaminomethyl-2-thiouridine)(34)-methyltransferase MnmD [Stieleria sp. JC731]